MKYTFVNLENNNRRTLTSTDETTLRVGEIVVLNDGKWKVVDSKE